MSVTIELPSEIEQTAKAKAEAQGVSLEEYHLDLVARVLQQEVWEKDEA